MYNPKKSPSRQLLVIGFAVLALIVLPSPGAAEETYGNLPPDANMMGASSLESVDLPFDPNDYSFLVYVPQGGQDSIKEAMKEILGRDLEQDEIRTSEQGKHVTLEDLATHDILIVGWNAGGDTSGLDPNILAAGITGRVILTGHDADYHTVHGPAAAEVFFVQAIDWVLKGEGTGLITLGCTDKFPYLPERWDVSATVVVGEDVDEFTEEGLASGVYDGLEPGDLSNWGASYHDVFDIDANISAFVPFELGGYIGNDIITVASVPYFNICKDDNDIDCIEPLISEVEHEWLGIPYNWLYYNIAWGADGYADTNVVVVDYLPPEVYEPNFISDAGVYDSNAHTVTWQLGDIGANDSGQFQIRCGLKADVTPGITITNEVEMEGDKYLSYRIINTNVCCWPGEILYVDDDANDGGDGLSWQTAYADLNDALDMARTYNCHTIWVAGGTYRPAPEYDYYATFNLVSGVPVYGGFAGWENSLDQRNLKDPANETILHGRGPDWAVEKIVSAKNLDATTLLDGLTVTQGYTGINVSGGGLTIANCNISNNSIHGINATALLTITHSTIAYNKGYGISAFGSLNITNSRIHDNAGRGIDLTGYPGPYVARNNTIIGNGGDGIYCSYPEAEPSISNCIVWGNNTQINPSDLLNVTYCCVQDGYIGQGNINTDPLFIDPNEFHLGPNSFCIDVGDSNLIDPNETDMDGECRIMFGKTALRVDIGADEYYWPKADYDQNGIVNFFDFAVLADPWRTEDANVNLIAPDEIDIDDLTAFCDDWLWVAPWSDLYQTMMCRTGLPSRQIPQSLSLSSATLQQPLSEADIEQLIDWAEDLWQTDETVKDVISESTWDNFLTSLKEGTSTSDE